MKIQLRKLFLKINNIFQPYTLQSKLFHNHHIKQFNENMYKNNMKSSTKTKYFLLLLK